jgi:hypothetical protein
MSNLNPTEQSAGVPADVDPLAPRLGTARRRGHSSVTSAALGRTALAVEARGVRKSFGDQVVLDGIDLDVAEGTVFALLGPNGSGKTTTVRILSTLLAADAGVIRVAGHEIGREAGLVRAAIGVTGQFSAVDKLLTGKENLIMMADLAHLSRTDGRRRAAELLDRFDLSEAASDGDPRAPCGADGGVIADRAAGEQAAHGIGEGGERAGRDSRTRRLDAAHGSGARAGGAVGSGCDSVVARMAPPRGAGLGAAQICPGQRNQANPRTDVRADFLPWVFGQESFLATV